MSVSVKDISIESFISNLFFIRIEIEMNGDGVCVEEKETIMRSNKCGWDGNV